MTRRRHFERHVPRKGAPRLRAGLLVVVWALSGVWFLGHALAHKLEHVPGAHVAEAAEGQVVSVCAAHGHGHSHLETLPAVSNGKTPKFEVATLLATPSELSSTDVLLSWSTRRAPARTSTRGVHASGPRAPPLS